MEPVLACLSYGQAQRKIVLPHTASRSSRHGEEYALIWAQRIDRIAPTSCIRFSRRHPDKPQVRGLNEVVRGGDRSLPIN
jgi:hypothetical protein